MRDRIFKNYNTVEPLVGAYDITLGYNVLNIQMAFQIYRDEYIFDLPKALETRDQAQASLVLEWMSWHKLTNKTAFFAHNLHISKAQSQVTPKLGVPPFPGIWKNAKSAGEFLRSNFGDNYKNIALTGSKLTSTWDGGTFPVPSSPQSLDFKLSQLNKSYLAINFEDSFVKDNEHWWMQLEHDENGSWLSPKEQYNAAIYVLESPADPAW